MEDGLGNLAAVYTEKCSHRRVGCNATIASRLAHGSESLREIDLSGIPVDVTFEIVFDLLLMTTEVRVIRMADCGLSDSNVIHFATKLSRNRFLRKVVLDRNPDVTVKSSSALLELVRLKPNITELSFVGTGLESNRDFCAEMRSILSYNSRRAVDDSDDDDFDVRKYAGTISHLPPSASMVQNNYQNEMLNHRRWARLAVAGQALSPSEDLSDFHNSLDRVLCKLGVLMEWLDECTVVLSWYDWKRSALVLGIVTALCVSDHLLLPSIPILIWYASASRSIKRRVTVLGVADAEYPRGPVRQRLAYAHEVLTGTKDWDEILLYCKELCVFLCRVTDWVDAIPLTSTTTVAVVCSFLLYAFSAAYLMVLFVILPFCLVPLAERQYSASNLCTDALKNVTHFIEEQFHSNRSGNDHLSLSRMALQNALYFVVEICHLDGVSLPYATYKCCVHAHVSAGANTATTMKQFMSWEWNEALQFVYVPNISTVYITVYDTACESSDFVGSASFNLNDVALDEEVRLPLVNERRHRQDHTFLNDLLTDLNTHDNRERRKYADLRPSNSCSSPTPRRGGIRATHITIRVRVR